MKNDYRPCMLRSFYIQKMYFSIIESCTMASDYSSASQLTLTTRKLRTFALKFSIFFFGSVIYQNFHFHSMDYDGYRMYNFNKKERRKETSSCQAQTLIFPMKTVHNKTINLLANSRSRVQQTCVFVPFTYDFCQIFRKTRFVALCCYYFY